MGCLHEIHGKPEEHVLGDITIEEDGRTGTYAAGCWGSLTPLIVIAKRES